MNELIENFANIESLRLIWPLLLQGLQLSVQLALVALPLSWALGLTIALLYSVESRWLRAVLLVWIDLFRSFPVLVLLVLIYFGLPFFGLRLGGFAAVVTALVLNNSGYFGEIFRAGIRSVAQGQRDAARALGFRPVPLLFLIVLPQALRNVIAPLASNSLELVKTTSIASMVALPELLRSARVAQEQTYNPTPLMAASVIFFVVLWPVARWVARLERQMLLSRQ